MEEARFEMAVSEEVVSGLKDLLVHLYEPLYLASEALTAAIGLSQEQTAETKRVVIAAIETLKPGPAVPPEAAVRRYYQVLTYRYLMRFTQDNTAEKLGVNTRYVRKLQERAIRTLATLLLVADQVIPPGTDAKLEAQRSHDGERRASAWSHQLREELASLDHFSGGTTNDLGAVLDEAVSFARDRILSTSIEIRMEQLPADLSVSIHPPALRQALLLAIVMLSKAMTSGELTISAENLGGHVVVALAAFPSKLPDDSDTAFIRETLAAVGGSLAVREEHGHAWMLLQIPAAPLEEAATVLVVDDNADLVAFYEACCEGTHYKIVHVSRGSEVFSKIQECRPRIVVLDVMLPDADLDGWEVLADLHEHPDTRSIPVIVCSVVKEEELALSLGAARYLPKPVWPHDFLTALDQVLNQAP